MNTLLWLRKPIGVILILLCGLSLAYAMNLSRSPLVQIRVFPARDIAPSEVNLSVSINLASPVEMIAWDHQGDGTFDVEGPNLQSQTVTFPNAGHFDARVLVTDNQGETYEATAQVLIENPEDLQATLNARWMGMLTALAKQDIEGALSFVASSRREVMRHDWTALADHLGEMANRFSVPLQLTDGRGYRVVAKSVDPLPMGEIQFPLEVQFVWESDNQWHVKSF